MTSSSSVATGCEAIATPGHTPDHLAYLLVDESGPVVLFSGGSLMVGTVGRTDLLGDEQREALARGLVPGLPDRILTLPDDLAVYPTHGAGSFCSAPGGGERTTTIGRERATNPLLAARDEDDFVDSPARRARVLPGYFRRLPDGEPARPPAHDTVPSARPRSPRRSVHALVAAGAVVVDARPIADFADGHLPGSLSIELRPVFARWLGLAHRPRPDPVVFVLDDDQDEADLVRQALTVGHDTPRWPPRRRHRAWTAAGRPLATTALVEPDASTDRCSTSARTTSSPPATSPAPSTSSSAASRRQPAPGRAR